MDFSKIPFTAYDFFGYLASGFLAIIGFPFILDWFLANSEKSGTLSWILLIILAYILGHIFSSLSKWFFELIIVKEWLKHPSINLFKEKKSTIMKIIFPEYFSAFPEAIRKKILDNKNSYAKDIDNDKKESLFYEAYAIVKSDKATLPRLDTFLILYGFCRTISFTLFVLSVFFLIKGNYSLGIFSLLISIIMFLRYLKFYRQYSYELFLSYLGFIKNKKLKNIQETK
jgi:uncharacterized membrane protein